MAKIESMALNVVLQLAKAELMSAYRTDKVEIIGVGFDWDVCESDEDGERSLMVTACIMPEEECFKKDRGTHPWVMVWDEETCEFHTLQRWDQEETDGEYMGYVGQNVGVDEIDNDLEDKDLDKELKTHVNTIRMDYPFKVEHNGTYNVYPITEAKTWRELIQAILDVCKREYEAGNNAAPHALTDYVIETIEVHPGGLATIGIGS